MKNFICFCLIFGWTILFPNLSFNSFTTKITDSKFEYTDLFNSSSRNNILETAEYDLWIKTIVLFSHE